MVELRMKNSKTLKIIGAIVGIGLIYYLTGSIIPKILVSFSKAAPGGKVSLANSIIIGEKILAKADGKDKCVVDVYVLYKDDKGVAKKQVALSGAEKIEPAVAVTNNTGKASFKIVSDEEGQFKLTAKIEGVELEKGLTVTFRD